MRRCQRLVILSLVLGLSTFLCQSIYSQPASFREEERAYQAALQYIEQHRKSDVSIKVVDQAGAPVKDAGVSYQQTTRDFAFGFIGNPGWATPSEEAPGWGVFEFTQGQYRAALPGKAQVAYGGNCRSGGCLHVKVDRDQNLGINSYDVSIESDAPYEVTFWIKVVQAPISGTGPTFGIYWGKGAVGSAWQGVAVSLTTPKLTVGNYMPITIKVTAPRAATRAIVGVRINMEGARPGDFEFYLDDASFTRSGSSQNLLRNSGFEEEPAWAIWSDLCESTNAWIQFCWQLWATIEPQRGVFHWEVADFWFQRILDRCPGARFVMLFSDLSYPGVPRPDVTPAWANADKLHDPVIFEQFKQDLYDYVYQVVKRYGDKVQWWSTQNELNQPTTALQLLGTIGKAIEVDRVMIKAIRDAHPEAKVLLATSNPGWSIGPYEFAQLALASGLQVDGITVQAFPSYVGEAFTPVWYQQYVRKLASLGKPVFIQETGYPSQPCPTAECFPAWGNVYDEATQAAWVKYMTAIPYGTEDVIGVLYVFAVDQASDWEWKYMGLFTREGRTKQAYDVYREHIQMFTTSGRGLTDDNGKIAFRGFAGKYTVTVTAPDGRKVEQTIHVREKAENNFTIRLP